MLSTNLNSPTKVSSRPESAVSDGVEGPALKIDTPLPQCCHPDAEWNEKTGRTHVFTNLN